MKYIKKIILMLLISTTAFAMTKQEAILLVQNAPSVYGNTLDCVQMAMVANNASVVGTGLPGPKVLGWTAKEGKSGEMIVQFHYISEGTKNETATWILKPSKDGNWKVTPYRKLSGGFAPVCTER